MIGELIIGFEDAVGEPVVPHELPDIFDWIELWTFAGTGMMLIFSGTISALVMSHLA
jgi:hypothetical protein